MRSLILTDPVCLKEHSLILQLPVTKTALLFKIGGLCQHGRRPQDFLPKANTFSHHGFLQLVGHPSKAKSSVNASHQTYSKQSMKVLTYTTLPYRGSHHSNNSSPRFVFFHLLRCFLQNAWCSWEIRIHKIQHNEIQHLRIKYIQKMQMAPKYIIGI